MRTAALLALLFPVVAMAVELPAASYDHLPRWRGFNLLNKFQLPGGNKPFAERDFELISRWGFNFVRLPMDYRCWIKDGNWEQFDERTLEEIDRAVEWGGKYKVHVCINFHRAPGYTVAKPAERTSLWTDAEAQRVCALHWATFARRYKGIPNSRLSFNLLNEPHDAEPARFVAVITKLVEAIRKEDPDRLIISDGMQWATKPVMELAPLNVAQAGRGYAPGSLTHYKASWVAGSEKYPEPQWPAPEPIPGTLLAPGKGAGAAGAITIDGPFDAASALRVRVAKVSMAADLAVEADGKAVFGHAFKPGPGQGEWKTAEFVEKYKLWQNTYDKDYAATIPAGTKRVTVRVVKGDWAALSEIGLKAEGAAAAEAVVRCEGAWGKAAKPFRYAPADPAGPILGVPAHDRRWLLEQFRPFLAAREKGVGIVVGEWGSHNRTPHAVVLRWAEDNLANWKANDVGWALWNLHGSFGVLDSGRTDVAYESFEGHKLDRKLLELLQRY